MTTVRHRKHDNNNNNNKDPAADQHTKLNVRLLKLLLLFIYVIIRIEEYYIVCYDTRVFSFYALCKNDYSII